MSPFLTTWRSGAGLFGVTLTGFGCALGGGVVATGSGLRSERVMTGGGVGCGRLTTSGGVGSGREAGGRDTGRGAGGFAAGGRETSLVRFRLANGLPGALLGLRVLEELRRVLLATSGGSFLVAAGAVGRAGLVLAGLRDHQCFLAGLSAHAST